jgi:1,4-alpha-glucan branching enzyme
MAKKEDVKKAPAKTTKAGERAKAVKSKAVEAKAPTRVQKKGTAKKKPARAKAKAKTTLRLEAPQAEGVFIVGSFNEWDPTANPLERDERGTWICTLAIEPGEHEYRFVVDEVWWDDPVNMFRRWNEFGTQNCVLIVED